MSSLEELFGKLAMTTVNTVSRIAISQATNMAIKGVTTYVTQQSSKNKQESRELTILQRQLDLKIKNLKPTIDIIAHSVADGNRDLEPALEMCNDLTNEIDLFAQETKTGESLGPRLRELLSRVDDAIPSLHLALRSLTDTTVAYSPAMLLQASHALVQAKGKQSPVFPLRLYSLFAANIRDTLTTNKTFTWKEELFKCDLTLQHKPPYDLELHIKEDLNDGRYHEDDEEGQTIRIDVKAVQKMYYTKSGTLLDIDDAKSPVLVFKVLKQAPATPSDEGLQVKEARPEIERSELQEADWYAVALWSEDEDEEEEEEEEEDSDGEREEGSKGDKTTDTKDTAKKVKAQATQNVNLLLLESVVRLGLLETSEQMDHLSASDDLLNLYMD
ncbi:RanGTP-binding protein-domain-containing protein [Syncephalastrum racemosum]|uniref:RanGTP-binding protein-domain-containing protein n=1 Tax=Syncephalastrum racemosum TaxID=13706 RepID=A0A1X2HJ54_SYNRA|nr:RanGTP-binding protein-domain-containing protein [Syncephalastrum racemosum]